MLLQIFFWYFAALRALPLPEDAEPIFGVIFLTIKGLFIPAFVWNNLDIFLYSLLAAIIAIIVIRSYSKRLRENEGKQYTSFIYFIRINCRLTFIKFFNWWCNIKF